MAGTSKPDDPSQEEPDIPGPLPELPSLDPINGPADEDSDDGERNGDVRPLVQPGTQ
jgi:hypothetical protein